VKLVPGNHWTLVFKRARSDRLVLVTAFLVVLLSTTLVSAIPIYANAVAQSGLRARLERAPVTEANVQVTVDVFDGGTGHELDRRVSRFTRDVFETTGAAIFRSGESEPFRAAGRVVVFGFVDGISRHARPVSGRWPAARAAPVEVAVPDRIARDLHLRVGDELRARSRLNESNVVVARVVGIYRAARPTSVYWWDNPLAVGAFGPLVTTRPSFFALRLQDAEIRWRLEPDLGRLRVGEATSLRRKLVLLPGRLNAGRPSGELFDVDTNLPALLAGAKRSLHLARAGVLVPSMQLAVLALYGLIVTTGLLVDRRRLTTESLRLRGATALHIVVLALMEASLIALPAVAVAPWLAVAALPALNHVGPLAAIGLRLEPGVSWEAYALAAAAGAVCVAALAVPALGARRLALARERRRAPLAGLVQRARLDLVLVVLALLGYWQLRRYHSVLVSHRGGLGIDPFLVIAPAVLLLAGALLSLRLVPLAAALVERVAASTRGAVPALGVWQLARRPRAYARSVLLLVLAVAIGVFAAAYSRTWHRSQVDQARYAAGADVLVEPSSLGGAPPAIDLASAYRTLGVTDALPAATDSFDISSSHAESANLLALDARRAGATVHPRADFATRPLVELLRPLAGHRGRLGSLPLPGRPIRLALSVGLTMTRLRPQSVPGFEVFRPNRPSLFLYLEDGDGVLYLYRFADVAPGRTTRLILDLTRRLSSGRLARPRYPLAVVGLELDVDAPVVFPRRATFILRSLRLEAGRGEGWREVSLGRGRHWRVSALGFKYAYDAPRVEALSIVGGSPRAVVTTGSTAGGFQRPVAEFLLRPGRDSLPEAPPVLASDSFLEATDATVGQIVPLALSGGTHAVHIVGAFHRFPTLDPATPSVLADLPTYLASSFAADGHVVQPSEWWLHADDTGRIAESLRAPPLRSVDVVSRGEREHALLEDPVPLGVIGALALGFVVAAAFAAVGFAASAAAAARTRRLEFAVLRSLGLRTRQLSGWIGLEGALVVALSLLGGSALGLLVAWLVLPYVALGTSGAAPVPPVRLAVPWATVLWLELALLAALVAVGAAQVALVGRLRLAPALRSGEGALAP
jgi:hypothetical protein